MDSTTHRKYPSESPGEVAEEAWNQSSLGMKHEGPLRKPSLAEEDTPEKTGLSNVLLKSKIKERVL